MKILFITSSSGSRGGGEIYLLRMGKALRKLGHEVALWASDNSRMDELCQLFGDSGPVFRSAYQNTYDRKLRGLLHSGPEAAAAVRIWMDWRPDLLHINKQNLEDGLDLLAASDSACVPTVCTVHLTQKPSSLGAILGGLRDTGAQRALRRYRGSFVAVHESRAEELRQFIGDNKKVVAISNGVEIPSASVLAGLREKKRQEIGIRGESFLVLGVGRFVEQKRPLNFLRHAARIKQERPDARFIWLGAENEKGFGWVGKRTRLGQSSLRKQWNQLVVELNLADSVRQLPWQPDPLPFWAAADLYLHTACYEGLPFSLLEAMAAGVPVAVAGEVRKDLSFLNEANSVELALVPEHASWDLKNAQLGRLSKEGIRTVTEDFSIERMGSEYEKLYKNILQKT